MKIEDLRQKIINDIGEDEEFIGVFQGMRAMKIWLFFIIGPLAALSTKQFYVVITNKTLHFHSPVMFTSKFDHCIVRYDDIEHITYGKGWLSRPITFVLENGRKLTINAQVKGVEKVMKISEEMIAFLQQKVDTR